MKKITLLIGLLLTTGLGFGQTTLSQGDIVITGVNANNPDQFSFVLLTAVLSGTEINFTDKGWVSTGRFPVNGSGNPNTEGNIIWTATGDLVCGTEIIIGETVADSNVYTATYGAAIDDPADGGYGLNANGDELIAFQGTKLNPSFIYAVHFGNNSGWTDAVDGMGDNDNSNSAVPAGLSAGINAIDLGNYGNSNYLCTETSNKELILETLAIVNATNWEQNDSTGSGRPVLGGCTFNPCSVAGTCASTVTWNGSWSGTPNLSTEVIIAANYSTSLSIGSFNSCSLTVNTGVTLTVENDTYIAVQNDVTVDGTLTVETRGNFVQNDDSGLFTVNTGGESKVIKVTPPKADWFYYTYWSSPVVGETIGNVFPLVDGDRRFSFNAANFVDTVGDDIGETGNDWEYALSGDTMLPGIGYAATAAKLHFPGGTDIATFTGEFNTGDIDVNITFNPANLFMKWNFIGNPYPSAIDFAAFYYANSSVVEGVAYLWDQATPPSAASPGNEAFNFSLDDYATFTVGVGGVGARSDSGSRPNGYIASGQGFFIPAVAVGTATFTNAMRMADGTSNSQFFKSTSSKKSSVSSSVENRLWVNLTSDNGVFNQILVGYVNWATNAYDGMAYDAPRLVPQNYGAVLYSTIENDETKYIIQGKDLNSANIDEVLKIGFNTKIEVPTLYTLSIGEFEGEFLSANTIYLKDNLLNKLHNLTDSDYTFTSEVGEFKERFEIVFNANALSVNAVTAEANALKIVDLQDSRVQFSTSNGLSIKNVQIYDLLGRQLYNLSGERNVETYTLSNLSKTVYIAKVTLSNGAIITKKAVKR